MLGRERERERHALGERVKGGGMGRERGGDREGASRREKHRGRDGRAHEAEERKRETGGGERGTRSWR